MWSSLWLCESVIPWIILHLRAASFGLHPTDVRVSVINHPLLNTAVGPDGSQLTHATSSYKLQSVDFACKCSKALTLVACYLIIDGLVWYIGYLYLSEKNVRFLLPLRSLSLRSFVKPHHGRYPPPPHVVSLARKKSSKPSPPRSN